MVKNPIRTLSGVAPMAVMIPPRKCKHGTCVYCPSLNVPQSYTPKSPAVLRARKVNYSSFKQVKKRLLQFREMGHPTDKVEIIVMGGTFLSFPQEFQFDFIKGCYDALNGRKSKTLNLAKKLNEKAKNRCVALCIETRPDICNEKDILNMLEFGCTRVELGVQAIDDNIYKKINRGHTIKDVLDATKRLKERGFKVGYHIMWGLPGSTIKKDIKMFKELFSNPNFRPDQLKIYPCQVIAGAEIEKMFYKRKYKPYTKEEVKKMLTDVFPMIPAYCRVMRVMREIPGDYLIAGIFNVGIRGEVEQELRKIGRKIKEIRYREIGIALRNNVNIYGKIQIEKICYNASGGKEIFLQAVSSNGILFGLLRLRISGEEAFVRELHVYGPSLKLGKREKGKYQHKGLGKKLLLEAENLVHKKKLRIISGIGVRDYYKKLGYKLDGEGYMVKNI